MWEWDSYSIGIHFSSDDFGITPAPEESRYRISIGNYASRLLKVSQVWENYEYSEGVMDLKVLWLDRRRHAIWRFPSWPGFSQIRIQKVWSMENPWRSSSCEFLIPRLTNTLTEATKTDSYLHPSTIFLRSQWKIFVRDFEQQLSRLRLDLWTCLGRWNPKSNGLIEESGSFGTMSSVLMVLTIAYHHEFRRLLQKAPPLSPITSL